MDTRKLRIITLESEEHFNVLRYDREALQSDTGYHIVDGYGEGKDSYAYSVDGEGCYWYESREELLAEHA